MTEKINKSKRDKTIKTKFPFSFLLFVSFFRFLSNNKYVFIWIKIQHWVVVKKSIIKSNLLYIIKLLKWLWLPSSCSSCSGCSSEKVLVGFLGCCWSGYFRCYCKRGSDFFLCVACSICCACFFTVIHYSSRNTIASLYQFFCNFLLKLIL